MSGAVPLLEMRLKIRGKKMNWDQLQGSLSQGL
jgi:hypothetical protein